MENDNITLVGGEEVKMRPIGADTDHCFKVLDKAISELISEIDYDYDVEIYDYRPYINKFRDSIYEAAKKALENHMFAAGPRGRIGGVPEDISERADRFQNDMEYPYDSMDIWSAYSQGAMDERKLNEK